MLIREMKLEVLENIPVEPKPIIIEQLRAQRITETQLEQQHLETIHVFLLISVGHPITMVIQDQHLLHLNILLIGEERKIR
jgi:hypothetical protein